MENLEKLERVYNRCSKALGIDAYKAVEKIVKTHYKDCGVPTTQMFKIPTKWEFRDDVSISANICILIDRNICEYVAKKKGFVVKEYTFKNGGVDINGDFVIVLNSPEEYTKQIVVDIEYSDNTYHVIYNIPEITE